MDERNIRHTIEPLSHDDFADFLLERNFHEDLISLFVSQRITGTAFLRLSEEDLKELIPIIGDRVLVRELLRECQVLNQ